MCHILSVNYLSSLPEGVSFKLSSTNAHEVKLYTRHCERYKDETKHINTSLKEFII